MSNSPHHELAGHGHREDCGPENLPSLPNAVILLDFDGTLVDIADTPDGIQIPPELEASLAGLHAATDGAMAIVSGRKLSDIERFLPKFPGTIYASHGIEWRKDGQRGHLTDFDEDELQRIRVRLRTYCTENDLLFEDKPKSLVVHFRSAPDKGPSAEAFVQELVADAPKLTVRNAKMAFEICHVNATKRTAVEEMTARFPDRRPVAFGDDTTDEDMFEAVIAAGGVAVKVGDGETAATHRLGSPKDVHDLLGAWLANEEEQTCLAD